MSAALLGTLPLCDRPDARVFHADWRELLALLPFRDDGSKCDLLCVDAPYSAKTHLGHDNGTASANRPTKANGVRDTGRERRELDYPFWTPEDVREFVGAWAPVTRGWIVSQTDDVLFSSWRDEMRAADRQTFQDVPAIIKGMTVRLVGDGPSSWAIHHAVSRPRTREFATWGTLRGGYDGPAEPCEVVGGKPLWLMSQLIRDYSRPGDLVCDPCCGSGRTGLAALQNGRVFVGGDVNREHAEIAARHVGGMVQRPLFAEGSR